MSEYKEPNRSHAMICEDCGALVQDITKHDVWHMSLKKIASDLYGVSEEDM